MVPDFAFAVQYSTSGVRAGGCNPKESSSGGSLRCFLEVLEVLKVLDVKCLHSFGHIPPSDFVAFHPFSLALQGFPAGFPLEVSSHQMWIRITPKSAREKQWVVGEQFLMLKLIPLPCAHRKANGLQAPTFGSPRLKPAQGSCEGSWDYFLGANLPGACTGAPPFGAKPGDVGLNPLHFCRGRGWPGAE